MKKILHKIKGFTLTELAIVIAVIAVLIAVLVPTFISLINSANETSDMVLVSNLNKSLSITDEPDTLIITDNGTDKTVYNVTTAITSVRADGYDVSKLSPTADGGDIVYNASTNKFLYYADNFSELAYGDEPESTDVLVIVTDSTLSRYGLAENSSSVLNSYSVQYCVYTTDDDVTIENNTENNVTVWVYTESTTATINLPSCTVYHDGKCTSANITTGYSSYHPIGKISYPNIIYGRYVPEDKGEVTAIYIAEENAANVVIESDDLKKIQDKIYTDAENGTISLKSSAQSEDTTEVTVGDISAATEYYEDETSSVSNLFVDYVVSKEATCTETGVCVYTTAFGTTVEVTISKLAHECETIYTEPILRNDEVLGYQVTYIITKSCKNCDYESIDSSRMMSSSDWTISSSGELKKYSGTLDEVEIPEGITSIAAGAFSDNTTITKVVIPSTVVTIDGTYTYYYTGAFSGCKYLTTIEFSESSKCTTIGAGAFFNCTSLKNIVLPDSITTISTGAFKSCKALETITIPENVKYIGAKSSSTYQANSVFDSCLSLTTVYFNATEVDSGTTGLLAKGGVSSGVTVVIGANVVNFYKTFYQAVSIKEVIFEANSICKRIEQEAFFGCSKLVSITLAESITYIGGYAFMECALTNVTIPKNVTFIGPCAFLCYDQTTMQTCVTAIVFENYDNWYYSSTALDEPTAENCTCVECDLTDSAIAATYLTSYSYYLNSYLYNISTET